MQKALWEKKMKVAVIGSRTLKCNNIGDYIPAETTLIISGGAEGIDTEAERYADRAGIKKLILPPDYDLYGKQAPLIRDRIIVDMADMVVALWDGESAGTMFSVSYAKQSGVPVKLYIL